MTARTSLAAVVLALALAAGVATVYVARHLLTTA